MSLTETELSMTKNSDNTSTSYFYINFKQHLQCFFDIGLMKFDMLYDQELVC